jgi:hypothetical protein
MRMWHLTPAIPALVLWGGAAVAADLSNVDRTIAKEPTYQSKPQYCLLVFGPDARMKVWLVFDGGVLYVDRKGNGDLTEEGNRVELRASCQRTAASGEQFHELYYVIGNIAEKDGFVPYTDLTVTVDVLHKRLKIGINGKCKQNAEPIPGDCPANAPVIHFDGPLTMDLCKDSVLAHSDKLTAISATVGTPGLGSNAFANRGYDGVPIGVHPIAEIEFPNKNEGGEPFRTRVSLDQRC